MEHYAINKYIVSMMISLDQIVVKMTNSLFCRGVSTFWITHPNNHLINNAAAGSVVRINTSSFISSMVHADVTCNQIIKCRAIAAYL